MDGAFIIDKPPGLTSHDVVAQVRHLLHERRVGHTGTLDPFATGLLVVLVGRVTRLAQFLSGMDKEYEAVIRLGYATDTGDVTGKTIPDDVKTPPAWTRAEIDAALKSFHGYIEQVPPMYSAKKQGGQKLYELARRGQEVERKPVRVCIDKFEATGPDNELPKDNLDGTFDFNVRVACSAGTYIRTLAEDFGKRLNVGAHLAELRRTRIGDFHIQQANTLQQLKVSVAEEALGKVLLTADQTVSHLPFVDLNADELARVRNGIPIPAAAPEWAEGERVRIRGENGSLIAVASFDAAAGLLRQKVVITREE